MIVREITQDPTAVINNFDWFNDMTDTHRWCKHSHPEIAKKLEAAFGLYTLREKEARAVECFVTAALKAHPEISEILCQALRHYVYELRARDLC